MIETVCVADDLGITGAGAVILIGQGEGEAFGQEGSYIKALNLKWRKIGEAKGINLLRDDRFDNAASEE